jgi:superoxide dismutase, Cu-Zn family
MTIQRVLPFVLLMSMALACGDDDGTAETTGDPSTSAGTMMTTTMMTTMGMTTPGSSSEGSTTASPDSSGSSGEPPGTSSSESGGSTTAGVTTASATLEPKSGSDASGTAVFTDAGDGTADLVVDLANVLPPGTHALHIHEFPDCSSEDGNSAGMHWNPAGTMLGELGTVEIGNDGSGVFMKSDAWSIGTGRDNDVVGRSIIIHADPDGGTRLACGVIAQD